MAIFRREKSRSTMPVLSDIAGEARQSWFGEDDDYCGQQICELNRAHQKAVGVVPGEGSQPTSFHVCRFINPVWMCLLTSFSKAGGRSLPLSRLLIAQLPSAVPLRYQQAPAGERGSGAGGRPNRRMPPRRRFPGSAAPRFVGMGRRARAPRRGTNPASAAADV